MGITKTIGFTDETNEMAEILKALGHPARLEIVKFLVDNGASSKNLIAAARLDSDLDQKVLDEFYAIISISKQEMYERISKERTNHITVVLENIYQEHISLSCSLLKLDNIIYL